METDEKILIKKGDLEKIKTKLKGLKVLVRDKESINTVNEIMELLDNEMKDKNISIKEMIHKRMRETEYSNPELNFKLYILYRKLSDNKISEEEALKIYKMY